MQSRVCRDVTVRTTRIAVRTRKRTPVYRFGGSNWALRDECAQISIRSGRPHAPRLYSWAAILLIGTLGERRHAFHGYGRTPQLYLPVLRPGCEPAWRRLRASEHERRHQGAGRPGLRHLVSGRVWHRARPDLVV